MLAISSSLFHTTFFIDYFRELFLAVLVAIYFGALIWSRPRRSPRRPTSPVPPEGTDLRL